MLLPPYFAINRFEIFTHVLRNVRQTHFILKREIMSYFTKLSLINDMRKQIKK